MRLPEPIRVMRGGVVSLTVIFLLTLAVFPAASTLRYSNTYVPRVLVFTDPERANDPVDP